MREKEAVWKNKYVVLLLIVGAVYFFLKYLSPLLAPILIAVLFLTMFYPTLDDIQKKTHIKKQFLAVIFIVFLGIVIACAAWVLVTLLMQYIPSFLGSGEEVQEKINVLICQCCGMLENIFGIDGTKAQGEMIEKLDMLVADFQGQVLPKLLNHSWSYAQSIFSLMGFIGITVIATVLLAKDYDVILDKMAVGAGSRVLLEVVVRVIQYIATFVKAQLIILFSIAGLSMLVLGVAGIEKGVFWGLLAGFLDVLPFIGTGIVLLPLGIWQLLEGRYGQAAVCLGLYIGCALLREFLEPRLIGSKVGVYPVAVLLAVYSGLKLFGIVGLFLGPIGMVMIQQIYFAYGRYVDESAQKRYDEKD